MAAQLPDIIIVNGQKMDLYTNPLEQYWIRMNKKRPFFYRLSTCERGYVATWEIKDKQLLLKNFDGNIIKRSFLFGERLVRYSLGMLFERAKNRRVKANWFSGKLRIPQGKMTVFENNQYGSRFEKEMIVNVDKGNVVKMVTVDNVRRVLIVNQY